MYHYIYHFLALQPPSSINIYILSPHMAYYCRDNAASSITKRLAHPQPIHHHHTNLSITSPLLIISLCYPKISHKLINFVHTIHVLFTLTLPPACLTRSSTNLSNSSGSSFICTSDLNSYYNSLFSSNHSSSSRISMTSSSLIFSTSCPFQK